MKWKRKYNVNLKEIHRKNVEGKSLVLLAEEYCIPRTTLNRYLNKAGYKVQMNRKNLIYPYFITKKYKGPDYEYNPKNTVMWKQALVFHFGHKCFICDYDNIVEAHHIVALSDGGKCTLRNGILLCPNHHAESHAGLLDLTKALIKLGGLLESLFEDNQQPSHISKRNTPSDVEGSTTNSLAKAVMETRAPKSRNRRVTKEEYIETYIDMPSLKRDKI